MYVYKTIILDAGEGKRLQPLTNLMPKCLLKLNEITILEHQLENLVKCNVKDVIFVVGYYADQIFQKLKERKIDLNVKFILNPIYYKTNTVYSLWLARNEINKDFIYLNGDVIFHTDVLKRLLHSKNDVCFAIDKKKVEQEEVKVQLVSGMIKAIGKEIEPLKAQGEFVGIAKFSQKFNRLFVKKLNEVVAEGKIDAFFEVALNRALKHYPAYAIDISDLPCIEIDSHEDLNLAKKIYQKIAKETDRRKK